MIKNSFKKTATILAASFCIFALPGCAEDDGIASVVFNENYQEEWKAGEIDFSSFYYTVTYKNGVVETVPVDISMIDENDLYKLYEPGQWQIKINFNDHFGTLVDFTIYENTFDESIKLENQVVVYDGNSHGLQLVGPIPEGTKIYYPSGNSFVDYSIEPYQIKCVLSKDGYKTKTLDGKLTITQTEYSKEILDKIVFEDTEYVYDGTEKRLEAKNIPSDCTIDYFIDKNRGNSRVNAGEYKVTGVITCSNINYLPIANIEAKLIIKKARYDLTDVSFDDKTVSYQEGVQQSIRLTNEDLLPTNLQVVYTNNVHEDAGSYDATASFICDPNFEQIPPMTATLNIVPAVVDLSNVKIRRPQLVTFDGDPQDFEIDVPELVKVEKTYYDESGALVENPIDVGTYKVKFTFSAKAKEQNYQLINVPTDDGVLIIQKKVLDLGNLDFGRQEYEYNSNAQHFNVENEEYIDENTTILHKVPDELEITTSYSINESPVEEPTNVGDYVVNFAVNFKDIDSNGHEIKPSNYSIINAPSQSGTLSIVKIKIDLKTVNIGHQFAEYVDDSTNLSFEVKNVPDGATYEITYYRNSELTEDTSQVGTYSVYVSFSLDEENYSEQNYELVNIPNGSGTLTVQKKKINLDILDVEDYSGESSDQGVSFPIENIINFSNIEQYVNPVFVYYKNGNPLPQGTLPKEAGDYTVDINFELKENISPEKYVIWSRTSEGLFAVMHLS